MPLLEIRSARLVLIPLCAAVCILVGCGGEDQPPTFAVSGTVIFPDKKPLVGARIQFRAEGESTTITARGTTDDQGRFELTTFSQGDGAIEGNHLVAVSAYVPDDFDGMTAAERRRAMFPIDPKFKSYETSGLTATVTTNPEENDFNFTVTQMRR